MQTWDPDSEVITRDGEIIEETPAVSHQLIFDTRKQAREFANTAAYHHREEQGHEGFIMLPYTTEDGRFSVITAGKLEEMNCHIDDITGRVVPDE